MIESLLKGEIWAQRQRGKKGRHRKTQGEWHLPATEHLGSPESRNLLKLSRCQFSVCLLCSSLLIFFCQFSLFIGLDNFCSYIFKFTDSSVISILKLCPSKELGLYLGSCIFLVLKFYLASHIHIIYVILFLCWKNAYLFFSKNILPNFFFFKSSPKDMLIDI